MARAAYLDCKRYVRGANQFRALLRQDFINGFGIGRKRVAGKETDDLAIVVYVDKKLALERLPLVSRLPASFAIPDPAASGGALEFITDVQEAKFTALALTARRRPAPSGFSIGHVNITAGTLGGLVRDASSGKIVILSNNHVLADSNNAAIGDPILQPGPVDGGVDPADRIATLAGFVEIDFDPGAENRVDAAIAEPVDPRDVLFATQDVGPETPTETRELTDADLGRFVHKSGRTTDHTQGYVAALFATVSVQYDALRVGTFTDQIVVSQSPAEEDFSSGGDSGSLIYDSDNRCVGLLFAGSQGGGGEPARTILNPIDAVLRGLDVELLAAGDHPSAAAKGSTTKKKSGRKA